MKAEKKRGSKLDKEGAVNPRVMKHIYDEARFCDNELFAEYFGGVLASSRTDDGKNDQGAYYTQIVQALSSYQLRCHYLFYYLIWHLTKGSNIDLNDYDGRKKLTLVLPEAVYRETFNITTVSKQETGNVAHSLSGLSRADLIADNFKFTDPKALLKDGIKSDTFSFVIEPTITGLELFNWAHGKGDEGLNVFLNTDLVGEPDLDIKKKSLAKLKSG